MHQKDSPFSNLKRERQMVLVQKARVQTENMGAGRGEVKSMYLRAMLTAFTYLSSL